MGSGNITVQLNATDLYAFEVLLEDHNAALLIVGLSSLIFGLPLAWNVLWHLKVRGIILNNRIFNCVEGTGI